MTVERQPTSGAWNEFDAASLGEEIGRVAQSMIADRDLRIAELEAEVSRLRAGAEGLTRALALADLTIENGPSAEAVRLYNERTYEGASK